MTECSTGTSEPELSKRSVSDWIAIPSAGNAGRGWNFIPLAPGLFGGLLAYSLYPLLGGRYVLIGVVFLFFLLAGMVPRAAAYSGLTLALLAAGLLLNGALNTSAPVEIKTTVIRKEMFSGSQKFGTHYDVLFLPGVPAGARRISRSTRAHIGERPSGDLPRWNYIRVRLAFHGTASFPLNDVRKHFAHENLLATILK